MRMCVHICARTQPCLTLCDPMDCSLPGSSVYGIFQVGTLDWLAIFLLQVIFPTQGLNPHLLSPTLQANSLPAEPFTIIRVLQIDQESP